MAAIVEEPSIAIGPAMEGAETPAAPSPPIRFLLSVLGLVVAIGAVLVDFGLLAASYSIMVGGGNYIGSVKLADVAALLPVLVVVAMGLFLTETRGITTLGLFRIFPDKLRVRMFWVTLLIIILLALNGAGVVYQEEVLLAKSTTVGTAGSADFLPAPVWARTGLALLLPFLFAFWAIPFEALLRVFRSPKV